MQYKYEKLVNEIDKLVEKYGLRHASFVLDSEDNLRTIIITDSEEDRDDLSEVIIECNYGFHAMVATKYNEGELN